MGISFEVIITIHVPRPVAYKGLLDLDAAQNWMQGLVEIERLDGGQMREGSQWRETRRMFGNEATEHFEVVELKEPTKIVLCCDGTKGTTGKGEYIFTYLLESSENQTIVTLHGEIKGFTGFAKFFGKLMAGVFKKASAKDLDALKNYLER
nr:SRPBCC family protein [Fredinandcohnia onubensis]